MALETGQVLNNRYRIVKLLGQGGFGAVYRAWDVSLNHTCALKENLDASPQSQQQFGREANILANLDHPNLPRVTDYFFLPDRGQYLVMDYVEGEDLQAMLKRLGGALPEAQALQWITQICDAIFYLHSHNPRVIHRDIKPANIKITPEGKAMLVDFGIAKVYDPNLKTTIGARAVTPGYSPPEQYGQATTDVRSDIYALGATFYTLLTNRIPIESVVRYSGTTLPLPRSINPAITLDTERVILRAMGLSPDQRYQTATELKMALVSPPKPAPKSLVWLAAVVGIVALVVLGFGAYKLFFTVENRPPSSTPTDAPPTSSILAQIILETNTPEVQVAQITRAASATVIKPTHAIPTAILPVPTTGVPPTNVPPTSIPPTNVPTAPEPVGPQRISFVIGSPGNTDIYIADANGANVFALVSESCDEAEPAWSPDGQFIVYQSNCGGSYDLWIVSSYGGVPTQLTFTSALDEREPHWSTTGQVAYRVSALDQDRDRDGEIWIIPADGGSAATLGLQGRSPTWSPDGKSLVFMSNRPGLWQIFIYDLTSRSTRQLTNTSGNCRWPSWSPDGQSVIYNSTPASTTATPDGIWYIPLNGGDSMPVVSSGSPGRPSWSGSGWIAFNSNAGIEIVHLDGGQRQVLINISDAWAPAWVR